MGYDLYSSEDAVVSARCFSCFACACVCTYAACASVLVCLLPTDALAWAGPVQPNLRVLKIPILCVCVCVRACVRVCVCACVYLIIILKVLVYERYRGSALVSTGIALAIPSGCYGRIAPRSGLAVRSSIDVGAGVIDPDYRVRTCGVRVTLSGFRV